MGESTRALRALVTTATKEKKTAKWNMKRKKNKEIKSNGAYLALNRVVSVHFFICAISDSARGGFLTRFGSRVVNCCPEE